MAYEDDSSKFIVGYGAYPTLTSKYSVEVLRRAIAEHGRPERYSPTMGPRSTQWRRTGGRGCSPNTEFGVEEFLLRERMG